MTFVNYLLLTLNCLFPTFNCLNPTFNCLNPTFNCLNPTFNCLLLRFNCLFSIRLIFGRNTIFVCAFMTELKTKPPSPDLALFQWQ